MSYLLKFIASLAIAIVSGGSLVNTAFTMEPTGAGVMQLLLILAVFAASAVMAVYYYTRRHDINMSKKQADLIEEETRNLAITKREDSHAKSQVVDEK